MAFLVGQTSLQKGFNAMLERHTERAFTSSQLEANRMQSPETEDRWYVDVGGTPKMMTLDQLVEAFEAGVINAKTLVTEVGGSEWKPLKEVADLGDDEEEAPQSVQAPAAAPTLAPAAPVSARPVAVAQASVPPQAVRSTLSAWPPVVAARPAGSIAPTAPSVPPAHSPSAAPSGAAPSMPPVSTMPVVQDLSLALDTEFKPRKSKAPIIAAAAVVLLVGGAFGAVKFGGGGEVARPIPVPAAAPVAVTHPFVDSTPTPTPAAAPAPTTTTSPSATDSSSDKASDTASSSRLSDDTKSKLKDADKSRADKKKAAKTAHAHAASSRSKGSSSSGVFRNGGNANDPLNAKL
jgi:hypothetical protein